jgi:hypothetical protein
MRTVPAIALVVGMAAGCSTTPKVSATTQPATPNASTTARPLPAGPFPSTVSKMVCVSKAASEVSAALGEDAAVTTPTWVDHLYRCRYNYPTGSVALSVKELSSWPETFAYFKSLETQRGVKETLYNLGQSAFQTANGSVVVRKDFKVLLVDDTGLPPRSGTPPTTPGNIAITVADVVLGCWAGD